MDRSLYPSGLTLYSTDLENTEDTKQEQILATRNCLVEQAGFDRAYTATANVYQFAVFTIIFDIGAINIMFPNYNAFRSSTGFSLYGTVPAGATDYYFVLIYSDVDSDTRRSRLTGLTTNMETRRTGTLSAEVISQTTWNTTYTAAQRATRLKIAVVSEIGAGALSITVQPNALGDMEVGMRLKTMSGLLYDNDDVIGGAHIDERKVLMNATYGHDHAGTALNILTPATPIVANMDASLVSLGNLPTTERQLVFTIAGTNGLSVTGIITIQGISGGIAASRAYRFDVAGTYYIADSFSLVSQVRSTGFATWTAPLLTIDEASQGKQVLASNIDYTGTQLGNYSQGEEDKHSPCIIGTALSFIVTVTPTDEIETANLSLAEYCYVGGLKLTASDITLPLVAFDMTGALIGYWYMYCGSDGIVALTQTNPVTDPVNARDRLPICSFYWDGATQIYAWLGGAANGFVDMRRYSSIATRDIQTECVEVSDCNPEGFINESDINMFTDSHITATAAGINANTSRPWGVLATTVVKNTAAHIGRYRLTATPAAGVTNGLRAYLYLDGTAAIGGYNDSLRYDMQSKYIWFSVFLRPQNNAQTVRLIVTPDGTGAVSVTKTFVLPSITTYTRVYLRAVLVADSTQVLVTIVPDATGVGTLYVDVEGVMFNRGKLLAGFNFGRAASGDINLRGSSVSDMLIDQAAVATVLSVKELADLQANIIKDITGEVGWLIPPTGNDLSTLRTDVTAVEAEFDNTTGHDHSAVGVPGNGPQIDRTGLLNEYLRDGDSTIDLYNSGDNRLSNGSFESYDYRGGWNEYCAGWDQETFANIKLKPGYSGGGNCLFGSSGASIWWDTINKYVYQEVFEIIPLLGREVTFAIYMQNAYSVPAVTGTTRIVIEDDMGDGTPTDVTLNATWTRYSCSKVINAGTTMVRVKIYPSTDVVPGTTADIRVDGATLYIGTKQQPFRYHTNDHYLNVTHRQSPTGNMNYGALSERTGWNYIIGDGVSEEIQKNIGFDASFRHPPIVFVSAIGYTDGAPVSPSTFTLNSRVYFTVYNTSISGFWASLHSPDVGGAGALPTNLNRNYGFVWRAMGQLDLSAGPTNGYYTTPDTGQKLV